MTKTAAFENRNVCTKSFFLISLSSHLSDLQCTDLKSPHVHKVERLLAPVATPLPFDRESVR